MVTAVVDVDWIRYAAGFTGEKRELQTIHKQTGDVRTFKNVTEFYGRGRAKDKGWIGEWNKANPGRPVSFADFDLLEIQKPEPIANVLHTTKSMVNKALEAVKADSYHLYFGRGDSFRVERSTILKYKGNRESLKKPLLLPEITEYLEKKMGAVPIEGIEADDQCIITAYKKKDHVVVSPDKDTGGCDVMWANPMKDFQILDCSGFGKLWLEDEGTDKEKVRGTGRLFFYLQVAMGDTVDNYFPHAASEVTWGEKSAYKRMVGCQNDQEALQAIKEVYQYLYPSPVTVEGWRGDTLEVDWLYAANEIWDLARMRRWEDDFITASEVFDKFGLLGD